MHHNPSGVFSTQRFSVHWHTMQHGYTQLQLPHKALAQNSHGLSTDVRSGYSSEQRSNTTEYYSASHQARLLLQP